MRRVIGSRMTTPEVRLRIDRSVAPGVSHCDIWPQAARYRPCNMHRTLKQTGKAQGSKAFSRMVACDNLILVEELGVETIKEPARRARELDSLSTPTYAFNIVSLFRLYDLAIALIILISKNWRLCSQLGFSAQQHRTEDAGDMVLDLDSDELGFVKLSDAKRSGDVDMTDADLFEDKSSAASPEERLNEDAQLHGIVQNRQASLDPILEQSQRPTGRKYIVAVDFGTTTSSVAFVRVNPDELEDLIPPERILCINKYPETAPGRTAIEHADNTTVPTELWYETKTAGEKHNGVASVTNDADLDDGYDSPLDNGANAASTHGSSHENEVPATQSKRAASRQVPVWGYGVQSKIALPDEESAQPIHITRFKLLLDEDKNTEGLRRQTLTDLDALKAARIVKGPVDIIADFLQLLFKHTKDQLVNVHDLCNEDTVQFVLCVPTMWTEKACRVMQEAMLRAIEASQLRRLENGGIKDLFIVAEPEAAAAYALSQYADRLFPGETFLVLDCGGGTVDAISRFSLSPRKCIFLIRLANR